MTSDAALSPARSFQALILTLQRFWCSGPAFDDERRRAQPCAILPSPHSHLAAVLGRARLRDPAALRHGSRRRHVPSRDDLAGARAEALAGGLRPALAPAEGRAVRRE